MSDTNQLYHRICSADRQNSHVFVEMLITVISVVSITNVHMGLVGINLFTKSSTSFKLSGILQ